MLPLVKDALVVQSSTAWTPGLCSCLTLAHFPVYKSSSVRLRVKGQNALYLSWFTQRQSLAPTPSTHPPTHPPIQPASPVLCPTLGKHAKLSMIYLPLRTATPKSMTVPDRNHAQGFGHKQTRIRGEKGFSKDLKLKLLWKVERGIR